MKLLASPLVKRTRLALALVVVGCGAPAVNGGAAKSPPRTGYMVTAPTSSATATPPPDANDPGEGQCRIGADPDKGTCIGAGGPSVSGKLAPELIARVVRSNVSRIRACYDDRLAKEPSLEGTVKIRFTIGGDGRVASAQDEGSQIPSVDVVECVRKTILKLAFPEPEGGTVTVVYPFVFEPG
ncbi:hypothetical protein BH09MYX1_BH09MYX1_30940 [soil metagenome]